MPRRRSVATPFHVALPIALLMIGAAFAQFAGAAGEKGPSSPPATIAIGPSGSVSVLWAGAQYRSLPALRRAVHEQNLNWERFVRRNPAVVQAFSLEPVRWGNQPFYTQRGLASWLGARGVTYRAWAKAHPRSAAVLRRNVTGSAVRTAASSDVAASMDTFVDSAAPLSSFGSSTSLGVSAGKTTQITLMRFTLPAGTVTKATLSLYGTGKGSGFVVRPVSGSWSESTTFTTRPAVAASPTASFASAKAAGWAVVDVTGFVGASRTLDLAVLANNSGSSAKFSSRETANAPRLAVELAPAEEPPPPPPAEDPPPPPPPPPAPPASGDAFGFGFANGNRLNTAAELDNQKSIGATWNRVDFAWAWIEQQKGVYSWGAWDDFVTRANTAGVRVIATLAYTPAWARPAGTAIQHEPYDQNLDDFARFAAEAVKRYAPRGVRHFEIWNEQNISQFWQPTPNPAKYTTMLKKAYAAIKATGLDVVVISGGFSPAGSYDSHPLGGSSVNPVRYLQEMYRLGAAGSFDALGHHPYDHGGGPYSTHPASAWFQMAGTSPSLRSLMVANGDGAKKIHATEFGIPSAYDGYTEEKQAKWTRDAVVRWRNDYPWAGVLAMYLQRDGMNGGSTSGSFWYYGLTRADGSQKPSWFAFRDAMR